MNLPGTAITLASTPTLVDTSSSLYDAIAGTGIPGIAGGVIRNGEFAGIGVSGKRQAGAVSPKIRSDDRFDLGSAGKAMTSTLIARLIEAKKVNWDTPLRSIFPNLQGQVLDSYLDITIWQLMTNRSGISDNIPSNKLIQYGLLQGSPREVRTQMLPLLFSVTPAAAPGRSSSTPTSVTRCWARWPSD
ncbi:MAG: serine hydrolase domain-containing protein [Tepidisphaeraceae bacterium]